MGTIAEKLEYLDGTREKILTETNRLGVGLTEQDKFRDYAKGLHDGYVDVLNNGTDILYDNMEKVSGSGSDITLENTEEAPMRSDLEGDTYQETITGKNLFDGQLELGMYNGETGEKMNSDFLYRSANKMRVLPNTTYTFSINGISQKYVVLWYRNDETYMAQELLTTGTFTTPTNCYYITFRCFATDFTSDFANLKVQLEKGTQATPYEEYTGGQPSPNPDYPQSINVVSGRQEVSVVGKNLFDKDTLQQGGLDLGGTGIETANSARIRSDFIEVQPNTSYVISHIDTIIDLCGIGLYKGDKSYDSSHKINNGAWNNFPYTFTTQSDTKYVRIAFRNADSTNITPDLDYKIQLELGENNEATEYEEYKGQSYEINLGKNLLKFDLATAKLYNTQGTWSDNVYSFYGIDATVNEDNTITIGGGSPTAGYNFYLYRNETGKRLSLQAGTYTFSTNTSPESGNGNFVIRFRDNEGNTISGVSDIWLSGGTSRSVTRTINQDFQIAVYIQISTGTGITEPEKTYQIQIEKGSTASSFSPYKTPIELCKINDYKDRIFRSKGVNLFDKDNANILNANITNTIINSSANAKTLYIPCQPNTTYTIQKVLSSRFRICTTSTIPAINVATSNFDGVDTDTKKTITTNETAKYLCVYYYLTGTDTLTEQQILDSIMINEGSTALPYEPYNSKGKWLLHKEIGKVNVDTSQITLVSSYSNIEYAQISKPNNYIGYNLYDHVEIKCNKANYIEVAPSGWNDSGLVGKISGNPDKLKWWLGFAKGTGITAIQSALSGSYIYYPLATPTTTEITDSELISQLEEWYNAKSNKDVTYISVTSEDLPAILNVIAIKKYE